MITSAFINIGGKRVGAIAWDKDARLATFEYAPGFINQQWDLSPLKMPLGNLG